jgi:phosphate:Na+ symporter
MIDLLLLEILGGVSLLLYGIRLTGQGFGLAFSTAIGRAWSFARQSRSRAFVIGAAGTAVLQSSGALVTLLISFGQVATLPLARSLSVILGADLGATLTVQVLSFRIYQYAFPVLSAGVALFLWGRKAKVRAVGQGILGFGFVLLSLRFLSDAAGGVGKIEGLRILMSELSGAPVTAFVWGLCLAAVLQSGTAVMVLLIAFARQGILEPAAVLPLVLGANVGGTAVAFVAASGLAAEGKRVAWGHFGMKAAGAVVCLPVFLAAAPWVAARGGAHLVANVHTAFNLALAVLFSPLVGRIAALLERTVPVPRGTGTRGRAVYLDREHLPVAGAALGQVAREIVRMADMIQEMLDDAMEIIWRGDEAGMARVGETDRAVNELTREIKAFLSALGQSSLDAAQTGRSVEYIAIVADLESIGDLIDKTVTEHFGGAAERRRRFSEEGERELRAYLAEVGSLYQEAVSAFVTRDANAARNVIARRKEIGARERELRRAHIDRLQRATPESLDTSAAHLDILSSWKAIASRCAVIAHAVLDMDEASVVRH